MPRYSAVRADGRTDVDIVYDMVKDAVPGDLFPYESLAEVLQEHRDTRVTRQTIHSTVRFANLRLLEEKNRTLIAVRNMGYRVLRANEIVGHAKRHERKAETQVGLALNLLRNTMLDEMNDLERRVHEQYEIGLNGVYTAIKSVNDKVERTDRQVQTLQVEQHATEDTMQTFMKEMIERIERLEQENRR